MAGKLISDLNSGTLSLADAMEIDKDVSGTRTSYKTTVKDIVNFANQNIAEEYDSTSTYAIGDYVMYESTLYKCTTAVSNAENFDLTKWTAVLVTDEMGSGGGGGTTVIANPQGTPTDDLNTLQVGSTIYQVIGEGGGGGFGLVQSGHTVYTLTGQNLEVRIPITFDTPFPEVPNVVLSLSDPSRGQYYDPQTGLGVMNVTENGFDILIKSTMQAVAGDITIYWIATTKFSGNGIFHPTIYSLDEREVGVWENGKPLYQKTFVFTPTGTNTNIDISSLNIDELVWRNATCRRDSGAIQEKDVQYRTESSGDNNYGIICEIRGTNLYTSIEGYPYSQIVKVRITLQYTKTTDVAGSGSWTPQGVPAVHYSTEEQVVGTWNGETLYGRMFEVSHTFTQGNNDIELQSNVDFVSSDIKTYDATTVLSNGGVSKRVSVLPDDTLYVNANNKLILYFNCTNPSSIGTRTVRVVAQYTKSS